MKSKASARPPAAVEAVFRRRKRADVEMTIAE
jgi:hypothetical protein